VAAVDLDAPPQELAAALAFRQRRIVLEAIGFAVDGFLDRALCGSRVLVLIARTGLRIDIRRLRCLRSCNRHGAENHQNRNRQEQTGLSHVRHL
jgi:hypothetical protein